MVLPKFAPLISGARASVRQVFRIAACIGAVLMLSNCKTAYKPPESGAASAKIDFAYIELGAQPGAVEVTSFTNHNFVSGANWSIHGKLTPAAAQTPETVQPQISLPIAGDRDFEFSFQFRGTADKNFRCSLWVVFTPTLNAEYLAVFLNKPTGCQSQIFRRTPQGLTPETSARAPKDTLYAPGQY